MELRSGFKGFKNSLFISILIIIGFQSSGFAQNRKSTDENTRKSIEKTTPSDQPDDVIRVDTELVSIPTTVFDRNGRYVTNLKKEDFQIFEDGIEQEIAIFETVDQPFTVFLLLDVSGSMSNRLPELSQAASLFVNQLRPDDQVIAGTFADSLYMLFDVTKVSELKKGIKINRRFGDSFTHLYDAVEDTLKRMKKVRGRKIIVLFSDGAGTGTFSSAKSNFEDAQESESLIYTVQFDTFSPNTPTSFIEPARKYMQNLADISGGRYYQIDSISNLGDAFKKIAEELRRQYNLGYYPKPLETKKKQVRQIKVKVRRSDLGVRARNNYVYKPKK
jgi:Ca-activated chloride channel homolog